MVKKLREVLKQHAANLDSEPSTANALDSYGNGDLLEFEEFMRMIKQCNSLLDVKQIRNAILTQIRKKRALIGMNGFEVYEFDAETATPLLNVNHSMY
jgi:hypothetical protein